MTVVVIHESMYGTTDRIAAAIGHGPVDAGDRPASVGTAGGKAMAVGTRIKGTYRRPQHRPAP